MKFSSHIFLLKKGHKIRYLKSTCIVKKVNIYSIVIAILCHVFVPKICSCINDKRRTKLRKIDENNFCSVCKSCQTILKTYQRYIDAKTNLAVIVQYLLILNLDSAVCYMSKIIAFIILHRLSSN